METCRRRGANCDNGELRGGVCPECLEEDVNREDRGTIVAKMLNCIPIQMSMEV